MKQTLEEKIEQAKSLGIKIVNEEQSNNTSHPWTTLLED